MKNVNNVEVMLNELGSLWLNHPYVKLKNLLLEREINSYNFKVENLQLRKIIKYTLKN